MSNPFRRIRLVPLGATGRFPRGKISPDDEGELQLGVTVREGTVILAFGKEISWVGLPPDVAMQLAQTLMTRAREAQGGRTQ